MTIRTAYTIMAMAYHLTIIPASCSHVVKTSTSLESTTISRSLGLRKMIYEGKISSENTFLRGYTDESARCAYCGNLMPHIHLLSKLRGKEENLEHTQKAWANLNQPLHRSCSMTSLLGLLSS